jgi:transcription initiation factor TFIIIB Brf1 subunit/transcription initiation factor TFIIB
MPYNPIPKNMCPKCGGQGFEKMDSYGKLVCRDCGHMFEPRSKSDGPAGDDYD